VGFYEWNGETIQANNNQYFMENLNTLSSRSTHMLPVTRGQIFELIKGIPSPQRFSIVFEHIMEHITQGDCKTSLQREASLCACRFIDDLNKRWKASNSTLARFLKNEKNQAWLSAPFKYPVINPPTNTHSSRSDAVVPEVPVPVTPAADLEVSVVLERLPLSAMNNAGLANMLESPTCLDINALESSNIAPEEFNIPGGHPHAQEPSTSKDKKRVGRPLKPFSDCSDRSKRLKTEHLRQNTPNEELYYATVKVLHKSGFHEAARAVDKILKDPQSFEAKVP